MEYVSKTSRDLCDLPVFIKHPPKFISAKQIEPSLELFSLSSFSSKYHYSKVGCPEEIVSCLNVLADTHLILHHYLGDIMPHFVQRFKQKFENVDKKFEEHMNKLYFMREAINLKEFGQAQAQILKEWKLNVVLSWIRKQWINEMVNKGVQNRNQLAEKLIIWKDLLGQLCFTYFGQFFKSNVLNSQNSQAKETIFKQNILRRLTDSTSYLVMTHCGEWEQFYNKVISFTPLKLNSHKILPNQQLSNEEPLYAILTPNYPLLPPKFPLTTESLVKFVHQPRIFSKIKYLLNTRRHLIQQIYQTQSQMVKACQLKSQKTLDKDNIIDCLVYCVGLIDFKISELDKAIQYMKLILGDDLRIILAQYQCEAYLTDLEVVANYMSMHMGK